MHNFDGYTFLKVNIIVYYLIARHSPSIKEKPAVVEFHKVLSNDILGKYKDLMEGLHKTEHKIAKQAMHKDSSAVSYHIYHHQ